jgi:hypothetical protein
MAQPLNATFFAFRNRGKSGVLTLMTITYLVLAFVISGVFFALNYQGFLDYIAWSVSLNQIDSNDPNAMAALTPPASVMALAPSYLLIMFLTYLLLAAYEAGALRWMIRGETGGLFGLSLGADTWRVWAGYWLWLVLFMVGYLGLIFAGVLVGGIAGVAGGEAGAGLAVLLVFITMCAYLIGWLYISVRLAPAAATSVGRKRFSFFDAWKVTKGRFWALLGGYLLLFVIFVVVYIIVAAVLGIALGISASSSPAISSSDPQAFMQLFTTPNTIAALLLVGLVMTAASMLLYIGMFGINARAVLAAAEDGKIDGVSSAEVAKTFE